MEHSIVLGKARLRLLKISLKIQMRDSESLRFWNRMGITLLLLKNCLETGIVIFRRSSKADFGKSEINRPRPESVANY